MKNILLIGFVFLSQVAFGHVRDEVVITSQSEIRMFLLDPHSYIYDLAATSYLDRTVSASNIMKERLKDYLTGSYHLSRVNTGSSVSKLIINLSDFNKRNDDDRIFVHFEYTNDSSPEQNNFHKKYVIFSSGSVFLPKLIENRQANIKSLDACKDYHKGHALACR